MPSFRQSEGEVGGGGGAHLIGILVSHVYRHTLSFEF